MLKSSYQKILTEAGCDEAGRGCLAGPVYAAAVILPVGYKNKNLNDSKKLSETQRFKLREEILKEAIDWSVQSVSHKVIDKINILNASFLAMHKAVQSLKVKPQLLLIDGNRFNAFPDIKHVCIVKGDGIYASIAAASILAKCGRDEAMLKLHKKYPDYDWINNKGYPTKKHRLMIHKIGVTPFHRLSYTLLPSQLEIDFTDSKHN